MSAQSSTQHDRKAALQEIKSALKKGARDVADAANDAGDEVRDTAESIGQRVKKSARHIGRSTDEALDSGHSALSEAADAGYGFARRTALRSRDAVYGAEAAIVDFARTRPGKALLFATLGGLVAGAIWRWTSSRR